MGRRHTKWGKVIVLWMPVQLKYLLCMCSLRCIFTCWLAGLPKFVRHEKFALSSLKMRHHHQNKTKVQTRASDPVWISIRISWSLEVWLCKCILAFMHHRAPRWSSLIFVYQDVGIRARWLAACAKFCQFLYCPRFGVVVWLSLILVKSQESTAWDMVFYFLLT